MRKINNRKSLILAAGGGKYVPNIVRGGNAIPLGNNFYYIKVGNILLAELILVLTQKLVLKLREKKL